MIQLILCKCGRSRSVRFSHLRDPHISALALEVLSRLNVRGLVVLDLLQ